MIQRQFVHGRLLSRSRAWFLLPLAIIIVASAVHSLRPESPSDSGSVRETSHQGGVIPTRTEPSAASPHVFRSIATQQVGQADVSGKRTLIAARPGATPYEGTADLRDSSGAVRTFVAGAVMRDGTKLIEIRPDRVLLERGGQIDTLVLDQ